MLSFSSEDVPSVPSASAGEEIVVSERVAALLVRHRAAEVIGVIDRPSEHEPSPRGLDGVRTD
jgi:hypothetical protein